VIGLVVRFADSLIECAINELEYSLRCDNEAVFVIQVIIRLAQKLIKTHLLTENEIHKANDENNIYTYGLVGPVVSRASILPNSSTKQQIVFVPPLLN
jgi:hypothetical protein